MARFANRKIMVTGAGSGLGLATANFLASEGALVIAVDKSFSSEIVDEIICCPVDVRDLDALRAVCLEHRSGQPFDGLATFAGIEMAGRIDALSPEIWRSVFEVNVFGSANAFAALLKDFEEAGRASVVLCSSQLSLSGGRDCVAYAASKGAINSMCRSLAVDHALSGIRVNAVAPGATETPMMTRSFANTSEEAQLRSRSRHAMGRFGTAEETAAAAAFLLSDEASFITGAVLPVDGGWNAA